MKAMASSYPQFGSIGTTLLVTMLVAACASPPEPDFDSAVPESRILATAEAARKENLDSIPHLIEGLESDDPAVRFMSIHTLERLTGQTHGYRHYDPIREREEAVDRWVRARKSGQLADASGPSTSLPTEATSP